MGQNGPVMEYKLRGDKCAVHMSGCPLQAAGHTGREDRQQFIELCQVECFWCHLHVYVCTDRFVRM